MRYTVDIEELVLHGFGTVDRRRMSAGVREELGRLLMRDQLPAESSERGRVDGGEIRLRPGDDRGTGRAIARRVHAGLRR